MKISQSYKLFAVTITVLLIIIGIIVFKTITIQDDVMRSEQHRFRSFLLAIELFQSSEDLTSMARSYVSTGKPIYEKRYFETLDIRNGKQPRPANYNATYWHLAVVGRGPAVAQGEAIALQDLMRREGFTQQELSLLRKSQANSDHLVNMEKQAFAAMKGLYGDGHGNLTLRRMQDRDYAIRLLFSDKYFYEKAQIMAPIQQFMDVLDKRTNAELISFQSQLRQYILLALAFIALTLCVVIIQILHTLHSILYPIERLRSNVSEIASGNFAARCDIISANEIGELSAKFNGMANFIEADILMRNKAEWALKERFKELACLYGISSLIDLPGISLEEILQKTVILIPPAWQFPEITEARIALEGHPFLTEHFRETSWMQSQKIMVNGNPAGQIDVCYLEERPISDEGPFLIEERQLIKAIAQRLGRVIERTLAEEALARLGRKNELILNSAAEGILGLDLQGNHTFINSAAARMLGYETEELIDRPSHSTWHHTKPDGSPYPKEECKILTAPLEGTVRRVSTEFFWRKDGTSFPVEYTSTHIYEQGRPAGVVVTFTDITERKRTESYREMGREILQILNEQGTLHESIQNVLTASKTRTGFDAVGIRLLDEDDFPYFAQNGFSNDFLLTENTLTERGMDGGVCRDKDGDIRLECTCGLVITGKTDPANPLFTKGGSFWTNNSFPLLDLPSDQDPRLNPRNQCIHKGYASVALVPIRTKDQIVGLIQFNDRRKNCFSLAAIEQFEGIATNIGEALMRKDAEEALLESEEQYRFIADHTADHIWTMDLSLRFIYSSPAVIKILGYTVAELMAQTIDQFFTPESLVTAEKMIAEEFEIDKDSNADPNRIRTFQSEHYHKNGTLVWLESSLTIIRDASMKPIGILGVSRDITERKKAEEQIQYLATHDLLTNLPSLRLARDRLSSALNLARRYKKAAAVMFIDLDGFKTVNDTLGHDAGDYVLQQVAQRLLSCVRETDTVARVGGDEFLIIATEINTPENVAQIAEKVIQLVSRPFSFKGQQAVVGASIGIALFPDHGKDMDQLINKADKAMYRVKNAGKNGFCFVNTAIK